MNVLMVDDEITAVKILQKKVAWNEVGISDVKCCYEIETAKKTISENSIDILICDIEMPKGSGLDLLEWIQQNKYPIVSILITCHADFEYAAKAIKMGVIEYIVKPVKIHELENCLTKAVIKILSEKNNEYNNRFKHTNKEVVAESFWRDVLSGIYSEADYDYGNTA